MAFLSHLVEVEFAIDRHEHTLSVRTFASGIRFKLA
jgi:hypothetical protein